MAFMEPEYLEGEWYVVEGRACTDYIPADVVGALPIPADGSEVDEDHPEWGVIVAALRDYTENRDRIDKVAIVRGVGARLQAPGYLDSTDWSVFDTEQEARDYIRDTYDVDPDTGDELRDWTVIVGNVGTVYSGTDEEEARRVFDEYVEQSTSLPGARCYGESVTLFCDGEPEDEHAGNQGSD